MDPVAEIKARLPIEELVGQYCQIQKKGRSFVSLCPFHNDTKPSLNISPEKGIAYCFACQSGGDIFSFYQKIEGVDFRQALKELAEKAGVELPREQKIVHGTTKDEKERLRECLQKATEFYQEQLEKSASAKMYLQERGVPEKMVQTFKIGYAPDSFDATYTHLLKAECSRSEILKAGLGIQKELQQERIYDRFRNRLMFPIHDHQGNPIGFGGRTLGTDDAKYINSPDGPLYNKSVALFGLSHAKDAIRDAKTVILVEGYFDVLAYHRIGIQNVVAVSGTALTEQHVVILKRLAERILLSLDADTAGMDAARRAYQLCKAQDLEVRMLTLPQGKDPDECIRNAAEELRLIVETGGTPFLEAVLQSLEQKSLSQKEKLALLLPLLHSIPSSVEREAEISRTATALGTTPTALTDDLERKNRAHASRDAEQRQAFRTPFSSVELLLGLLLTYPLHLAEIRHLLEPEEESERTLYYAIKNHIETNTASTNVAPPLPEECRERGAILQLYAEEHFGTWSEDLAKKEIRKLVRKVNMGSLRLKQQSLITQIRNARTAGQKIEEEKLLTQYQQVLKLAKQAR